MWNVLTDSGVFQRESEILKAAIDSKPDHSDTLYYELEDTDSEMLVHLAKRNGIKPLYAFGKLRIAKLLSDLHETYFPLVRRFLSLDAVFFVVAYNDGGEIPDYSLEISDLDIIEEPLGSFECPEDAKVVGCYASEEEAQNMITSFSETCEVPDEVAEEVLKSLGIDPKALKKGVI